MLNLGFFVRLPQLPMRVGESHNTCDGDHRREEGGQPFRSELADHFAGIIRRVGFSSKLLQPEVTWFDGVKVVRCPPLGESHGAYGSSIGSRRLGATRMAATR